MDEGRKRLSHLRDDPRVALTVLDEDNWYTHVSIIGHVADIHDDKELTDIDRLAQQYLGKNVSAAGPRPGQRLDRGRPLARLGQTQGQQPAGLTPAPTRPGPAVEKSVFEMAEGRRIPSHAA